jgi:hypothetical protein
VHVGATILAKKEMLSDVHEEALNNEALKKYGGPFWKDIWSNHLFLGRNERFGRRNELR